ncbi:hypothetical protein PanWU01x14_356720, partial [Parasponia andersonii]
LSSRSKLRSPKNIPLALKGKAKVDTSKKRKVAFEDILQNLPPLRSTVSQPELSSKQLASSSLGIPNQVYKNEEFLIFFHQLPEKTGLSAAFIDRLTSDKRLGEKKMEASQGHIQCCNANVGQYKHHLLHSYFTKHFSCTNTFNFKML